VTFSEPVLIDGTIEPAVVAIPETFVTGLTAALDYDTAYLVTIKPTTKDAFGNGIGAEVISGFATEVAIPLSGATIATGWTGGFIAAFDPDGVVTLAPQWVDEPWMQTNPKTGSFEPILRPNFGDGIDPCSIVELFLQNVQVSSWRRVLPNQGAIRTVGLVRFSDRSYKGSCAPPETLGGMASVWWKEGTQTTQINHFANHFIPTPASCSEGQGLGSYGLIANGSYVRQGRQDVDVDIDNPTHLLYTSDSWTLVDADGALRVQTFRCPCGQGCSKSPVNVLATGLSKFHFVGTATPNANFFVYSSNNVRMEACQHYCPPGQLCPAPVPKPADDGLMVAAQHRENWILGALVL
jgi:hypothetical protein